MKLKRLALRLLIFFLTSLPFLDYAGAQIIIDLTSGDTTEIGQFMHEFDSALLDATVNNDYRSVLEQLNKGADPNAATADGITALMYASESGSTDVMKVLLLNGAGIETTLFEGATPLHFAVRNKQFDAAKLLLEKGANPDRKDHYGLTPLLYAAALNCYEIADLLIFFGADKELADRENNSPLMVAVYNGNMETADVLLQNEVDPDHKDRDGNTPLNVAAQYNDTAMISLLTEYHADINSRNKSNYTPLATAIRFEFPEAAGLLLQKGADADHKITINRNIYDLSKESGCKSCTALLDSAGAKPTAMPDFSELNVMFGNSIGSNEYLMHTRLALVDRKFGFYFTTGFDFRPTAQKIQLEINDTLIFQYMEKRLGWSHGAGKYFTLFHFGNGGNAGLYLALNGYLSFSTYRGLSEKPPVSYVLIPSAGAMVRWDYFGLTAGVDRYQFGSLYERNWKFNISAFVRFSPQAFFTDKKAIIW